MSSHSIAFDFLYGAKRLEQRLDGALSNVKGVSFSEFRLLATIQESNSGSLTRVDLASLVGLTPSGVTRALKPLEKLGYVKTVKGQRDARQAHAVLTRQGKILVKDGRSVIEDTIADVLSNKPLRSLAQLMEAL